MGTFCSFAFLLVLTCSISIATTRADDRKTAADIIRSRGFDVETYEVISQNYVLMVYRIVNPLADPKMVHKIPIVAHHGIGFNAANMMSASILARPRKPILDERVTLYAVEDGMNDKGLHFYLSNNNYDVWLLEARGATEQNKRISNGWNGKSLWDFSMDEQALIDLPTQIDFIMKKTGSPKVAYISYSQSTLFMFALLSMRPEFSEKLATFIALAPVVFTAHVKGIVKPGFKTKIFLSTSSAVPILPNWFRKMQNFLMTYGCSISIIKYSVCRNIWSMIAGHDKNAELKGGITENAAKPTSMKAFEQVLDNAIYHDFRMYDYKDERRNLEEYGQPVPPGYNISKITLKTIVLFRGTEDYLSDPKDQMILISRLRVPLYEDHILEDYAHLDFIVSPTVTRDINEPILRALDKLTGRPVKRVSHTLGRPNPQVEGTKLVMDVKDDAKVTPLVQGLANVAPLIEPKDLDRMLKPSTIKEGSSDNMGARGVRGELSAP